MLQCDDTKSIETTRNFNGHKVTSLHTLWKSLIGIKWNSLVLCWVFWQLFLLYFCLCHRRIINTPLMALEVIPQVYKTKAAALPHTTPEHHIFTLPSLPPDKEKPEGILKSIIAVTITAIFMVTIIGIVTGIYRRFRYSSPLMWLCFLLYLVSKWQCGTPQTGIFVEIVNLQTSKIMLAHLASVAI